MPPARRSPLVGIPSPPSPPSSTATGSAASGSAASSSVVASFTYALTTAFTALDRPPIGMLLVDRPPMGAMASRMPSFGIVVLLLRAPLRHWFHRWRDGVVQEILGDDRGIGQA